MNRKGKNKKKNRTRAGVKRVEMDHAGITTFDVAYHPGDCVPCNCLGCSILRWLVISRAAHNYHTV